MSVFANLSNNDRRRSRTCYLGSKRCRGLLGQVILVHLAVLIAVTILDAPSIEIAELDSELRSRSLYRRVGKRVLDVTISAATLVVISLCC
jgi:hypothetical protein